MICAVVLAPIIFYAIFNVYRSQVNPRIKFSDFLFIVAGVAVVANLVSLSALPLAYVPTRYVQHTLCLHALSLQLSVYIHILSIGDGVHTFLAAHMH